MKLCKRTLLLLIIPSFLVGCGDPEPTFEQQIKLKELETQKQIELARISADKQVGLANANAQNNTYSVQTPSVTTGQVTTVTNPQPVYQDTTQIPVPEEGYSGSSIALGVLGGAVAGYYASELLDGGWSTGYDSYGNTVYRDSNNRVVSADKYKKYKTTHKVTKSENAEKRKQRLAKLVAASKLKASAAKDKAKVLGSKAANKAKPMIGKAKVAGKRVVSKAKPVFNKTKQKVVSGGKSLKDKAKPVFRKAVAKTKAHVKTSKKR